MRKPIILSNFDVDLKRKIKIRATEQDKSMTDYIQEVLRKEVMM